MNDRSAISEQAAAWHIASANDDMDWDGFMAWLEVDSRHRDAYDEIALSDAWLEEHKDSLLDAVTEAETAPVVIKRRWRAWGGIAIAASLVVAVTGLALHDQAARVYSTASAAQQIALSDGSRIALAPHSRLTVGNDEEDISLEGGAYFIIRHDPGRTMTVKAGPIQISDIGTEFDVQSAPQYVRVEVSDGRVQITARQFGQPIELARGAALMLDRASSTAEVREADTANMGAWRTGRLNFSDAPLVLVAVDLKRYTGLDVSVADGIQGQRFSGTLAIDDGHKALTDLAEIMGLDIHRDSRGYRLVLAAR